MENVTINQQKWLPPQKRPGLAQAAAGAEDVFLNLQKDVSLPTKNFEKLIIKEMGIYDKIVKTLPTQLS